MMTQTMSSNSTSDSYESTVMHHENKTVRVHRVGSITLGCTLVVMGVMFILHMINAAITYAIIFRFWPAILIGLGIEVLVYNSSKKYEFVYDKAAVFILVIMTLFAMCMAGMDILMTHYPVDFL